MGVRADQDSGVVSARRGMGGEMPAFSTRQSIFPPHALPTDAHRVTVGAQRLVVVVCVGRVHCVLDEGFAALILPHVPADTDTGGTHCVGAWP